MKICIFGDSFFPKVGGMEFVIHHLAQALTALGHDVHVIVKIAKKIKKPHFEFKHNYKLTRYGYKIPLSGYSGLNSLSSVLTLLRIHRKEHFDIINCHSVSYAGSRAVKANKKLKLPLVMTPHGEDIQRVPEINYGLRLKKRWNKIIQLNLRHADAVTAISDSIKNELDFLPKEKIFKIPNGIDLPEFSEKKNSLLHDYLSIDNKKKIVLSVGRSHIKKGYEYGIKAFDVFCRKKTGSNLVYVIVGRNSKEHYPLVQKLGLEEKVFLVPETDRKTVLKYYQSSWCFFSPSIIEGLSMVSIEAMAGGLPLIVTDVPGNIDIVKENDCGIIVKNKNPESMANGIIKLCSDQGLYDQFSRKALEQAVFYDWSNIAKKYIKVYKQVIDYGK